MNINTKNFQRFLVKQGWTVVKQPNERLILFDSAKDADGDWFSVALPQVMTLADAPQRIADALSVVAESMKIPRKVLARSLERWDLDLINTRLNSRSEPVGSIPLPLANLIIDDLRSFVGYAAYSQVAPAKFFPRAGKAATDYAATCRFGHTFEGSFGMTIECPLTNVNQLTLHGDFVEPPFERLVTQRIATGFLQFHQAIRDQDPMPLLEGYQTGMNANMLRSLADIFQSLGTLEIEYGISWSPEITPPDALREIPTLKFNGLAYELAHSVAIELEREDEEETTTVSSYVVSLKSEMPLSDGVQDEFEHVITLDWEREGGAYVRIRVVLPAGEYKKACDAHKEGRKILVCGIPKKEGKFWFLTRPSDLKYVV